MSEIDFLDSSDFIQEAEEELGERVEWPENSPDPRILRSSYSSDLLFQSCPRKFQLTKLSQRKPVQDTYTRITFGFGHTVGTGVQEIFSGASLQTVIWNAFLGWKEDLFGENEKQKKTFFHGVLALQKLYQMREEGFLEEWEVATFNGKLAIELSFCINLPNGFQERGYVDAVLRNKYDGSYAILENKTSSAYTLNPTTYKNSAQAIGYSVVLDQIAPGLTDYTVQYLVYLTRLERWEHYEFPKTYRQRALWLRDKLWTCQQKYLLVQQEGNHGVWPMHGQSCASWGRDCEYLGACHMPTERMVAPLTTALVEEEVKYDFVIDWQDLVAAHSNSTSLT